MRAKKSKSRLVSATILVVLVGALGLPYAAIVGGAAGPMRLLFPVYALLGAMAIVSWRRALLPTYIVALFAFTPFLRRLIDYDIGYEPLNPVLLAPYVALLVTIPALTRRVLGQKAGPTLPFTLILICVVYAAFVAFVDIRITPAIYEAMRWLLPVALCAFIMDQSEQMEDVRRSLHIGLLVIIPILTVYGLYQYINPPLWDTFWLTNSHVTAFGLPAPYEIRVFGMMNSPMSLAVFVVSGMILLTSGGVFSFAVAAAALPLIAVTLVRSSWLMCAVCLLVLFIQATPARKLYLFLGVILILFVGVGLVSSHALPTDMVNHLDKRFSTFSNVDAGSDESAQDRLATYGQFFDRLADSPLGEGFGVNASTVTDSERRELVPLDSAILESALTFGVVLGEVYFITIGILVILAYKASWLERARLSSCFAVLAGIIVTTPISGNLFGEASILAWIGIGFLLSNAEVVALRRKRQVILRRNVRNEALAITRAQTTTPEQMLLTEPDIGPRNQMSVSS